MNNIVKKTNENVVLLKKIGIVFFELFTATLVISFIGMIGALLVFKSSADFIDIVIAAQIILYIVCALLIPVIGLRKFPITEWENSSLENTNLKSTVVKMITGTTIFLFIEAVVRYYLTKKWICFDDIDSKNIILTVVWCALFVVILPMIYSYTTQKLTIDRIKLCGRKKAILFSATMFLAVNLIGNHSSLYSTFVLGLLLAYIYVRTSNIKYCMITNIIFNALFIPQVTTKIGVLASNLLKLLSHSYLYGTIGIIVALVLIVYFGNIFRKALKELN